MKTFFKTARSILLVTLFAVSVILVGCGSGGGGGDGVNDAGSGSSSGGGNVALFVTDGPADEYSNIWISVTKVLLIPSDRNPHRSPVVIFESDVGYEIELLDLRDQDFLLTIKKRVPAGWYAKIRLEVNDIRCAGGPCASFELKLPSNRIDLNPRGDFEVRSGETLAIRLDVDANKSINLHVAGNSGRCIFRPVVFVEIDTIETRQRCPRILTGQITRLLRSDSNIEGFALKLEGQRGTIDVWLSDNPAAIIFGEDGFRVRRSELTPGQRVHVRGKITSTGDLTASVVVIGDIEIVKGTVISSINSNFIFPLLVDEGQSISDDQINVEVTDATLVMLGCDEAVSTDAISPGKRARVVGKTLLNDGVLRAVGVFLKSEEMVDLLRIVPADGGANLIIMDEGGIVLPPVFLPQETPIYLQGDGEISLGLLNHLLSNCDLKKVRIALDPEAAAPTALEVRVQQERLYGQVAEILSNRTVRLNDGRLVRIQEGATIMLNTRDADIPVDFDDIGIGHELTLYGLRGCDNLDVDFYAYIVFINDSATDD